MKEEVIISQGKRSLWHNIKAAFLYTVTIFCVYIFFKNFDLASEAEYVKRESYYLQIGIFSFASAVYYSIIQTYYFDFKNNRYKYERAVLFFKFGAWKPLPELEYISVFKNGDIYEVNLWYVGNKHFKIYSMFDEDEALEVGKKLAITLQIDLLDATVANDSKWVEL